MSNTRIQNVNERFAKMCDSIGGDKSHGGKRFREINRNIERKKRKQFRGKK